MNTAALHRVGDLDDPSSHVVRIVHVSDTHRAHDSFINDNLIPSGDILIHSGDFDNYHFSRSILRENDYLSEIAAINTLFSG